MRLAGRARRGRRTRRSARAAFDRAVAEFFMRLALDEAAKGVGRTSPNPAVGAVLVKAGRVVARGHHKKAGTPHAEVLAIRAAGARARGADLYTTLEPCDHWGRTPPCSLAILKAGIRRVLYASGDPNPRVNGQGLRRLRRAGIQVVGGVLQAEADRLNRPFFQYMRTGLPWVTLKAALTLDGKLAAAGGDSRWVTGEPARRSVHALRDRVDAILVGAGTVARDDPRLTTRLPGGRDAVRVVVDSHLRAALRWRAALAARGPRTIIACVDGAPVERARRRLGPHVEVWALPAKEGHVALRPLLRRLGDEGLLHVLVEGGAQLFGSLLREQLAHEVVLFLAPRLIGAEGLCWTGRLGKRRMAQALELSELEVQRVGRDLKLTALLS